MAVSASIIHKYARLRIVFEIKIVDIFIICLRVYIRSGEILLGYMNEGIASTISVSQIAVLNNLFILYFFIFRFSSPTQVDSVRNFYYCIAFEQFGLMQWYDP